MKFQAAFFARSIETQVLTSVKTTALERVRTDFKQRCHAEESERARFGR